MLGIDNLFSKYLWDWVFSGEGTAQFSKLGNWLWFALGLFITIIVALIGKYWSLYKRQKKDYWSLITTIGWLSVILLIPYDPYEYIKKANVGNSHIPVELNNIVKENFYLFIKDKIGVSIIFIRVLSYIALSLAIGALFFWFVKYFTAWSNETEETKVINSQTFYCGLCKITYNNNLLGGESQTEGKICQYCLEKKHRGSEENNSLNNTNYGRQPIYTHTHTHTHK
jgi:hypothetical protein